MQQDAFALDLRHDKLISLLTLWQSYCSNTILPMAQDLDIGDLRPWMDQIVLVNLQGDQIVYSYYSPVFADAFEGDRVGQSLESLPLQQRQVLKSEYDLVRSERRPLARLYTGDFNGAPQTWERLVLPFFSEKGEVKKILVAAYRIDSDADTDMPKDIES